MSSLELNKNSLNRLRICILFLKCAYQKTHPQRDQICEQQMLKKRELAPDTYFMKGMTQWMGSTS